MKVLFICEMARMRSRTAAVLYADSRHSVKYAGIDPEADVRLTKEDLEWSDIAFVMDKKQRHKIRKLYPEMYFAKTIICLYVPDIYKYMDEELQRILGCLLEQYLGPPNYPAPLDPENK